MVPWRFSLCRKWGQQIRICSQWYGCHLARHHQIKLRVIKQFMCWLKTCTDTFWPRNSRPCYWNFGQFEEGILDATLKVLMKDKRIKSPKGEQKLRDPVWLGRILSAAANSSDENGILMGNWSGNYEGGISPLTWNGSVKIIQQFIETGQPVKYGQCWVFSGLLTTLMRSIGVPCRSVTNFASAHDTGQLTQRFEFYMDHVGKNESTNKRQHNDNRCICWWKQWRLRGSQRRFVLELPRLEWNFHHRKGSLARELCRLGCHRRHSTGMNSFFDEALSSELPLRIADGLTLGIFKWFDAVRSSTTCCHQRRSHLHWLRYWFCLWRSQRRPSYLDLPESRSHHLHQGGILTFLFVISKIEL